MCSAEFVDVGVGMAQVSPYVCEVCHAVEASPHTDEFLSRPDYDPETGWYRPPGDSP